MPPIASSPSPLILRKEDVRRQIFITLTKICLISSFISSIVFILFSHDTLLMIMAVGGFTVVLMSMLIFKFTHDLKLAGRFLCFFGHFVLLYFFASGGWNGSGLYFSFAYLPLIFFLAASSEVLVWVSSFIGVLLLAFGLNILNLLSLPYTTIQMVNFFVALNIELMSIFFFKRITNTSEQVVEEKIHEISEANNKLEESFSEKDIATQKLTAQTQSLEDLKQAMLNVMGELRVERDSAQKERAADEAILSSLGEGLINVDNDGRITKINAALIKLLGLTDPNVIGKKVNDTYPLYDTEGKLIPGDLRPGYLTRVTGKPGKSNFEIHRADGSKSIVTIVTTPVFQNEKVVGAVSIFRDITREREVDRMKTEFISLASHQLRTPLSAIKWFSEMLLAGDAGKLSDEQNDFAKNIADSTERMIQLVNSLLNISRIESGRIIIDPKPTNLKELVEGVVTDLKAKLEKKKLNLIISVHDELPTISIDPKLIGQVYLNLLTNAIKYTPAEGDITVFISKKGDEIISQITDTGYGIPKVQQTRIFQKFFRADNIIKVETDGTGLGLYLVKAIVESSKGKIWFESEESKGTTFWFSLPLTGTPAKAGEVTLDV